MKKEDLEIKEVEQEAKVEKLLKIRLTVQQRENLKGEKYNTYSTKEKGSCTWATVKFTKKATEEYGKELPDSRCDLIADVNDINRSIEPTGRVVYWVQKINDILPIEEMVVDITQFFDTVE